MRNANHKESHRVYRFPLIIFSLSVTLFLMNPLEIRCVEKRTGNNSFESVSLDSLNVRRVGRALFEPFGAAAVLDGIQFIMSYTDLVLYDVSDPNHPSVSAYYPMPGTARDLAVSEDYVFYINKELGFYVIDRNDGYKTLSSYDPDVRVYRSVISGDVAYLTCEDSLHIIDISNPHAIRLASKSENGNVAVREDTCFVVSSAYGLRIMYVGDPENPQEIGSYPDSVGFVRIAVSDTLAYVLDDTQAGELLVSSKG